jgi:sigma-B regulation protein RsbU (phosphoserine phosphatase)
MYKILVIDDDPVVGLILKRTLQEQGFEVSITSNGYAGLNTARDIHPALIICDWVMPGLNGLEVCQQIKADPALSHTFFILLTSRSEVQDRVVGLDTGADDFLSKPIDVAELQARVRAGLRLYQVTRELQAQKKKLEAELAEAAEYVRSILPPPLDTDQVSIVSCFFPSSQLGGDCFDYYWLNSETLVIYLLDVAGHGVKAALLSVSLQNLLRTQSLVNVHFDQPTEVLTALNKVFDMDKNNQQYFTLWYGVYHLSTRQLAYASAGHPPALLFRASEPMEVQQLKTKGMPIGIFPDAEYASAVSTIDPQDRLYLLSDGIYEFSHVDGSFWDIDRFASFLREFHLEGKSELAEIFSRLDPLNSGKLEIDDRSLVKVQFS